MNELTPTRSLLIALGDERRTMREGSAFLDEKCLLLAGEMLRETRRQRDLMRTLRALDAEARHALHAALGRHGLDGLQVYAVVPAGARRDRAQVIAGSRADYLPPGGQRGP